jgi:hypothetical protein
MTRRPLGAVDIVSLVSAATLALTYCWRNPHKINSGRLGHIP